MDVLQGRMAQSCRLTQWSCLMLVAVVITVLLRMAGFPSDILVGPMLGAVLLGLAGANVRISSGAMGLAQGIAGVLIASRLSPPVLHELMSDWAVICVFVLATFLISIIAGGLLFRISRMPFEQAMWGLMPGMAAVMITIADARGVDGRVVAFVQYTRLLGVVLATALASSFFLADSSIVLLSGATPEGQEWWQPWAWSLGLAGLGLLAQRFVRAIPSGAVTVPMLLGAVLQGAGVVELSVPTVLLVGAYAVIGFQVGLRFTPALVRHVFRLIPAVLVVTVALLILSGLSGAVLATSLDISLMTGFLATVPGSIDAVALIALSSGADPTLVIAMQTLRLFAVILIGPPMMASLCRAWGRRFPA